MITKWNFSNEPSQNFGVVPAFTRKSSWKPLLRIPNLEVFLSQVKSRLFKETQDSLRYFNLSPRGIDGSKILRGREIYSY